MFRSVENATAVGGVLRSTADTLAHPWALLGRCQRFTPAGEAGQMGSVLAEDRIQGTDEARMRYR